MIKKLGLAFYLFFFLTTLYAQEVEYNKEFGFKSDNDAYLFVGFDRYYTNGLFISYRQSAKDSLKPNLQKRIVQFEIGQKMYNAFRGNVININRIDRPYAGYLYAGSSLNYLYKNENSLKISLQAGVLGPAALGKETQEFLHKTIGFYEVKGWDFQVENEIGINASVDYNYFMLRTADNRTDISFNSYVNLGNTFTAAGAGLILRSGSLNQLYQSVLNNSVIGTNSGRLTDKEFFIYGKPMVNLVFYDGSIQGGLFRDDKGPVTFGIKPLVLSGEGGVMYAKNRLSMSYGLTFKSREVKSSAGTSQYGTFSLFYRFN